MIRKDPIRVLLDTMVLRHTATTVSVYKKHSLRVASIEHTYNVLGMQRNIHHISSGRWIKNQVEALPTVMKQAREGKILIYNYIELEFEIMKGNWFELRGGKGDLFKDIKIELLPSAVERSKLYQMDMSEYLKKETLIKFCKFLLEVDFKEIEKRPLLLSKFTDFEKQNLKSLNRFKELCSSLDETHYPDALHLWTAEVNGLDFFLTSDRKFINVMTQTSLAQLKTKPICPVDLLDFMGIKEREPMPINDYDFQYLA